METLERSLKAHPFVRDMLPNHLSFIVGCATNVRFRAGEFVSREGEQEHALYLVRHGAFVLETIEPGRGSVVFETFEPGDVFGISWLTQAHLRLPTNADCRAREPSLCFRFEGDCLKAKMDSDPALGYALTTRLLERTYARLSRARLQSLDVYK